MRCHRFYTSVHHDDHERGTDRSRSSRVASRSRVWDRHGRMDAEVRPGAVQVRAVSELVDAEPTSLW